MTINNPNDPATSKQKWALFCATKKDYRNINITKQEASDLLAEANKNRSVKSENTVDKMMNDLYEFVSKNYKTIYSAILKAYGNESIVMNDTNFVPDDGKRYKMYGICAVSYLKIKDKRSKLAKSFIEQFSSINDKILSDLHEKFKNYDQINAVLAQDYGVNCALYDLVGQFLAEHKIPVTPVVHID